MTTLCSADAMLGQGPLSNAKHAYGNDNHCLFIHPPNKLAET